MKLKIIKLAIKPGVNNYNVKLGAPNRVLETGKGFVVLAVDPATPAAPCTFTLVKVGEVAEGGFLGKCGEGFLFSTCFA